MILKLAWRNIISRPKRALATIFAIAIAIAMIFCMLSFNTAVYEFIYATETADTGNSDILIKTTSSSDRIFNVDEIEGVEGIKDFSPVLSLYAQYNNEYLRIRGFDSEKVTLLQSIDIIEGSIEYWKKNTDRIIISKTASEDLGLSIDDEVELKLGTNVRRFYVGAIANDTGYFANNTPYVYIGNIKGVSGLIGFSSYNEVYVSVDNPAEVENIIQSLSNLESFKEMNIGKAVDVGYIERLSSNMSAPIAIAGGAVVLLAIASITILFLLSEKDKTTYIARLGVVGASKKQIFAVFLLESIILAFIGLILGIALASGLFILLLKIILSSTITFSVSPLNLLIAGLSGAVVSILASLYPLAKAFKGSIRENELSSSKSSKLSNIFAIATLVLLCVLVIVEFTVPGMKGVLSIVNIFLLLVSITLWSQRIMRLISHGTQRVSNPVVKVSSFSLEREKRFSTSTSMLTVGMTISMILFMAWSLTTSIFEGYMNEISNLAFISNTQADMDESQFLEFDGVDNAYKACWKQAGIKTEDRNIPVSLIGSKNALDILDFEFVTSRDIVQDRLMQSGEFYDSSKQYIFIDISCAELYGYDVGDSILLDLDNQQIAFTIGGILKQSIFNGQYVVMSEDIILETFNVPTDTVILKTTGDIDDIVAQIMIKYEDKNYFILSAEDMYKWSNESTTAIFDLVGTLAGVITLLIFFAVLSSIIVGRSTAVSDRRALLMSGMSKNTLLKTEVYQHSIIALLSFILSFIASVLFTALLINALRLFDMYYNFLYNAGVVAICGLALSLAYILLPFLINYKKGYSVKRQL